MSNVIIVIHGLGNKPPKPVLEKWWKKAIQEGMVRNGFSKQLTEFEMVYWADVLHKMPLDLNETDTDSPYFVEETYVPANPDFEIENHDTRKKIVDFLQKQIKSIFLNDDLSLNYSFITDSIIHKYFSDLDTYYTEECIDENDMKCEAHLVIRERLIKVLKKHQGKKILLISHSMGSIVAYDVLKLRPEITIDSFITIGSPLGLPVVVSKIAAEQKRSNKATATIKTPENITKAWYNFADITDKVAFYYKLSDTYGPNLAGIKPVDELVVNNYRINGKRNSHKSFGYLRTKVFSEILNDFICTEELSIWQKLVRKCKQVLGD